MIFGVSMALHEEAVVDTRTGAFVNRDLAEYLVPVHADIPEIDAVMLDGFDDKANELGAKGVGELGNCGADAAVANAVYNATGCACATSRSRSTRCCRLAARGRLNREGTVSGTRGVRLGRI